MALSCSRGGKGNGACTLLVCVESGTAASLVRESCETGEDGGGLKDTLVCVLRSRGAEWYGSGIEAR